MLPKNFELTLTKAKNYKIGQKGVLQSNCDIDFFIFRHRFRIMRQKFLKFESDQNAAKKFELTLTKVKNYKIWQKGLQLGNCDIDILSFAIAFVLCDQNF